MKERLRTEQKHANMKRVEAPMTEHSLLEDVPG